MGFVVILVFIAFAVGCLTPSFIQWALFEHPTFPNYFRWLIWKR